MKPRRQQLAVPSLSLPNALTYAAQLAQAHGERHTSALAASQTIGWGHNKTKAHRILSALRLYGLLDMPQGMGQVVLTETCRRLLATRDPHTRDALRLACLKRPDVFATLLKRFPATGPEDLPSDETLEHALVGMGLSQLRARGVIKRFRRSLAFAAPSSTPAPRAPVRKTAPYDVSIPVRLSGGRKAWLTLPNPFYEEDKTMLLAQVKLIYADDEDTAMASPDQPPTSQP